jgi:hypothetical protein
VDPAAVQVATPKDRPALHPTECKKRGAAGAAAHPALDAPASET